MSHLWQNYLKPVNACRYFGSNIDWASLGDSHVVELSYAIAKKIEHSGHGLLHLSFSGCSPSLLFDVKLPGCSEWIREAVTYLENNNNVKNVLLGFRYSTFLFGNQVDFYPEIPNIYPTDKFTESFLKTTKQDLREIYWQGFYEIITRLLKSGKTVYILYPIPELPIHISKAVTPFSIFSDNTLLNLQQSTTTEYYFERNKFILNKLNSLHYSYNLRAIKPFEILCNYLYCPATEGKNALYFDDNHLSVSGAEKIVNSIAITY